MFDTTSLCTSCGVTRTQNYEEKDKGVDSQKLVGLKKTNPKGNSGQYGSILQCNVVIII